MACLHYHASALLHLGEWGRMLATLRDGIATAERNGHHLWATFFRLQIAGLYMQVAAHQRAVVICEAGLETSRRAGHRDGQVFSLMLLALARLGLGDQAGAAEHLALLEQSGQTEKHLVGWLSQMSFHHALAEHWLGEGDIGRARAATQLVCELAAKPHERTYLALGRTTLAAIALAEGDVEEARGESDRALAVLDGVDAPLAEWRACALAAQLRERDGDAAAALALWRRSAAVLQRLAGSLSDEDADLRQSLLASAPARAVLAQVRPSVAQPAARRVRKVKAKAKRAKA